MKTGFSKNFFWLMVLSTLAIAGLIATHSSQNSEAHAAATAGASTPAAPPATVPAADNSPAQNSLPPDILPASPLAEVIKLSKAGVGESVIMAYVTNSGGTFNLDSDKIIYLADVGVANEVVSAMMQHDQQWQQQMAAASAPQPASAPAPSPNDSSDAPQSAEPEPVTVNYFNTSLAPYGNWVDLPGYGHCWRPTVANYDSSWQPYCDRGQWVYTDCGWYWNSDYAWGATFHYGRWFRDARLGWCWWPDTAWAPSWVTWRSGDDFCGWAPLPPFAVVQPGIGFVYQGNGVSIGFDFGLAASCYTFVPTANFCDVRLRDHRFAPAQVRQIFDHTTVINNISINNHRIFNNGLTVQQISAAIGKPIRQFSAQDFRTALHDVRAGTLPRQNHGASEPPQVPVVTTRDPQERGRNFPDTQQHFAPGEHFNSAAPTENPDASPPVITEHRQPVDQNRTGTRADVEIPRHVNLPEENASSAPPANHPVPERNSNQSPGETVSGARADHVQSPPAQSRPQPAPVASPSGKNQ